MDINSFVIGYKKGKASGGGGSGGGVELNIAYGDSAPEDTTKLWVKTDEPSAVIISKDLEFGEGGAGDNAEVSTLAIKTPTAIYNTAVGSFGNKIYLAGGQHSISETVKDILVFNAADESITTISTKLPYVLNSAGSAVVGSKLYLLGGIAGGSLVDLKKTICYFDMATEEVGTVSATLPVPLYCAGCAAVGAKIYLFGGAAYIGGAEAQQNAIYCFDTEANSVEKLNATLPSNRNTMACAAVGTKIYILGGYESTYVNTILCFDTETSSFVEVSAQLPQPLRGGSCISMGTAIYILGGRNSNGTQNTIYRYDTVRDVVTELDAKLQTAVSMACAGFANGSIYMFSGYGVDTIQRIAIASVMLAPDTLQIVPRDDKYIVELIKGDDVLEIGVDTAYKGNDDGEGERVEMALYHDGEWAVVEARGSLLQEKTVDITENGTTEVTPDAGKQLSKVTINTEVHPEPNIAYGDTAPEDTTKLWVKTNAPRGVSKLTTSFTIPSEYVDSIATDSSSSLPSAMAAMGYALVGSKVYMFGGGTDKNGGTVIRYYDFEKRAFTTLSVVLPTACYDISCAAVGTKIYLFGGVSGSTFVSTPYCFDTETEQLEELSFTVSAPFMGCAAVGTKIYLFGGGNVGSSTCYNYIERYDTESGELVRLTTTLPKNLSRIGCAAAGTKIYLFGGHAGWSGMNTIYSFDTITEEIEQLATTTPSSYGEYSCVAYGDKIYITGGFSGSGLSAGGTGVYKFDTNNNKIERLTGISNSYSLYSAFVEWGGDLYAFGGTKQSNSGAPMSSSYCTSATMKITFASPMPLAEGSLFIQTLSSGNQVKLVKCDSMEIECGIKKVYVGNAEGIGETTEAAIYKTGAWAKV
jgi:N-acetylneuraminic acid mutarotase